MPDQEPTQLQRELIELEVKRAISKEVETYRKSLESFTSRQESLTKWIVSALGLLVAFVGFVFTYFGGKSVEDAKARIPDLVGNKIIELAIYDQTKLQLSNNVSTYSKQMEGKTVAQLSNSVSGYSKTLETEVVAVISNKVAAIRNQSISTISNSITTTQVELTSKVQGDLTTNVYKTASQILGKEFNTKVTEALSDGIKQMESLTAIQKAQLAAAVPPGTIVAFGGPKISANTGWLICDGSPVLRTEFSKLWKEIGTAWGAGDGTNTFNLPDLQGMFLRGVDPKGRTDPNSASRVDSRGTVVGPIIGSLQEPSFQKHSHLMFKSGEMRSMRTPGPNEFAAAIGYQAGSGDYYIQPATSEPDAGITGSAGNSETRPRNAYVYFIIKY